jgi:hypothetical protein
MASTTHGGQTIEPVVTIRQASRELGINRAYLKGYVDANRITLRPAGSALVMSLADFRRLKRMLAKGEPAASAAG